MDLTNFGVRGFITALALPKVHTKRKLRITFADGRESSYKEYIANLLSVFGRLKRVLKPEGSFWLNLGDTYSNKQIIGIPWRVAIAFSDAQGWILRNDVI